MLSKVATLKKKTKEDQNSSQQPHTNVDDDNDVPMTNNHEEEELNSTENVGHEEEQHGGDSEFNVWQRDPEKERDKLLGFFVISGQPIPRDIFHSIMSFIPAFPFYFMLRSVCSQWLYEFQEQVYGNVTYLNLVDDGRPKFYVREDDQIVQFKPIGGTGKGYPMSSLPAHMLYRTYYRRGPIFDFLGNVFPNVKHLKLSLGSFFDGRDDFVLCVNHLLPKLNQLETLDILGTKQSYCPRHYRYDYSISDTQLAAIAHSLPSSTKNLNFIGMCLPDGNTSNCFELFSKKRRNEVDASAFYAFELDSIHVDIQSFTLPYSRLDFIYSHADMRVIENLKDIFPHFELSIVEPESEDNPIHSFGDCHLPLVSYVEYLNYMSKVEGVCLSHIEQRERDLTDEMVEATVDTLVREYPSFQPLLTSSVDNKNLFQLKPYIQLDAKFVCRIFNLIKALELLTDPSRMKYPELVLDINATFEDSSGRSCTLLGIFIANCSTEGLLSMIKTIIEDFKPELAINGVRNLLLEALGGQESSPVRFKLVQYLLSLKPDLISLGDSEGIIRNDQKELPLIQLILSNPKSVSSLNDIEYLVEKGASLTVLDKLGSNVLHSACSAMQLDILEYLISKCPVDVLYVKNKNNETPLQHVFISQQVGRTFGTRMLDHNPQGQFLEAISKLSCFSQSQSLQNYPTSCGTLLHAALMRSRPATIRWLLNNGFDANSLNEEGENSLFFVKHENPQLIQFHPWGNYSSTNQREYVDELGIELIKAGAKVDIQSTKGETVVSAALRNGNYPLINYMMLNPSISSKPLSELLSPRMKHGLNPLHYLFRSIVNTTNALSGMNKRQKVFTYGTYPVARHCALLCLEHYPEMLYEKSEASTESDLEEISGLSPLQMLLEAAKGIQLLNDFSIKLSDIANKPVFASKDPAEVVPVPVMYLALEVAIDIPLFDKLMIQTHNVFLRDESQDFKPNLLHIAAERDASLCECIIKHWKKKFKTKTELAKMISQPLENDVVDGRKPRNAAILACEANLIGVLAVLWPYTRSFADQFDCPVEIALANKHHDFALAAVIEHNIVPSKDQLHQIIRRCLAQDKLKADHESKFVTLMIATEEKQAKPSWLELMIETPSGDIDSDEPNSCNHRSTLQLLVSGMGSYMLDWLVRHYSKDPLLDRAMKSVDLKTGDTLLHLLTSYSKLNFVGNESASILLSIAKLFRADNVQNVETPKRRKRTNTNPPYLENMKMEEFANFINIQNKRGRTCLHNVAVRNSQAILQELLEFGASTEVKDSDDKTPLELMSSQSLIDITNRFLDKKNGKKPTTKRKKKADSESDDDEDDDRSYGTRSSKRRKKTRK